MLRAEDFFDLTKCSHQALFSDAEYVWDGLKGLKSYIREALQPNTSPLRKAGSLLPKTCVLYDGKCIDNFSLITGNGKPQVVVDGEVLEGASIFYAGACLLDDTIAVGNGTVVEPGALIKGPTIIGDNTEVRQGAYIRGTVIVGNRCVVGHTTEIKSSIMLYGSKAGHFAYIGDSILGEVNLGAGTKCANLKVFSSTVTLEVEGTRYDTGLRKMGAIMGDHVELGCNTGNKPWHTIVERCGILPQYIPERLLSTPVNRQAQAGTRSHKNDLILLLLNCAD